MPWFSKSIDGPDVMKMKITFENLCSELNDSIYDDGVDRNTIIATIKDIYNWLVVDSDSSITLPATTREPDDRYRFIFPEGARVSTRKRGGTLSVSSRGSATLPKAARKLSSHYTRSHSSTSSANRSQPRYVGFAEDDDEPMGLRTPQRTGVSSHRSSRRPQVLVSEVRGQMPNIGESLEDLVPVERRAPQRPSNISSRSGLGDNKTTIRATGRGFADD